MVKPYIDPVTLAIVCPTCMQSQFTVFRRDPEAHGLCLNHCKCACGQLFVYHVDDSNQPVPHPAAFLATQLKDRVPSKMTVSLPRPLSESDHQYLACSSVTAPARFQQVVHQED